MKCSELEILICDYVDGALTAAEKATVELHLAVCGACRELVEDSRAAVSFMDRVPAVEPPAALVNDILFRARRQALPRQPKNVRTWLGKWFEPVLQPRFAMGMAMTILSFSMLGRMAGIPARQLKASDLEPARIWAAMEDKAQRAWDRTKKYYESLRLVYEIQSTLNDWRGQEETAAPAAPAEGPIEKNSPADTPGKSNGGTR
ncbi:MAG: zf-HC2 domain-containing protein [Bryobacterales bacterium]|nr:zf-HC2 domain-containing protein [Bryobacterales bacterium]